MDRAPVGIRFFMKNSRVSAGDQSRFLGEVTLGAHFDLKEVWEAVIQRLNGLEIHRGGDIQSELIEILQGQVTILEKELEQRGTVDLQRAQRAEQQASLASMDAVRAKQQVELLQAQLKMKDLELAEAMKANRMWSEWHDAHQRICHGPY